MPRPKLLTARQALARMRKGDLPTQGGGYHSKLFFDDGAKTSHAVGTRLHREGFIDRPAHTSVNSRYTLTEKGKGN